MSTIPDKAVTVETGSLDGFAGNPAICAIAAGPIMERLCGDVIA